VIPVLSFLLAASLSARADDVDPTPTPERPAPASPDAARFTPAPVDPRWMRLDGFVDAPVLVRIDKKMEFNVVEKRFRVVDDSGLLTVADIAVRLGDEAVLARRKKEVTTGLAVGVSGLAVAAAMLAVHSIEEVNKDPVYEPATAVTGTLGFIVGIGAIGGVIQANERPWSYWSPDELREKLTAYNLAHFGVPVAATAPIEPAPAVEAPPPPPAIEPATPPAEATPETPAPLPPG
jgi:hypothetical protein